MMQANNRATDKTEDCIVLTFPMMTRIFSLFTTILSMLLFALLLTNNMGGLKSWGPAVRIFFTIVMGLSAFYSTMTTMSNFNWRVLGYADRMEVRSWKMESLTLWYRDLKGFGEPPQIGRRRPVSKGQRKFFAMIFESVSTLIPINTPNTPLLLKQVQRYCLQNNNSQTRTVLESMRTMGLMNE